MCTFLWAESQKAILEDAAYAADILFLAGACDPERTSIAAARRYWWLNTDQQKRIDEICSTSAPLQLQQASWLPPQCHLANAARVQDDLRALFTK